MTIAKNAVRLVCEKSTTTELNQITIDLIHEIEDLLALNDITAELIEESQCKTDNLLEAVCPDFTEDITILTSLSGALTDWKEERESINRMLGLSPEE